MDLSELNEDVMQKREQLETALDTFGIPAKVITTRSKDLDYSIPKAPFSQVFYSFFLLYSSPVPRTS